MIFLIDLPPPIHGMSSINLALLTLCRKGSKVDCINTVPSYFSSSLFGSKFWFLVKIIHTLYCYLLLLIFSSKDSSGLAYRSVNGGFGQLFDVIYFFILRAFKYKIYVHHHSFKYLSKGTHIFSFLIRILGKNSIHIVLGEGMKNRLVEVYGVHEDRILVLSNTAFFCCKDKRLRITDNTFLEIGYLSNITFEKGINEVLSLFKELKVKGVKFKGIIAGPVLESEVSKAIDDFVNVSLDVEYIGEVYGEKKDSFFKSLDVLVFPSQYENEAEPLVLYEAANYGALLIGSQQGCMKETLKSLHGYSFPIGNEWVSNAVNTISSEKKIKSFSHAKRVEREKKFIDIVNHSTDSLGKLINRFNQYENSKP